MVALLLGVLACGGSDPASPGGVPPTVPGSIGISHDQDSLIVGSPELLLSPFIRDTAGVSIGWWPHSVHNLDPALGTLLGGQFVIAIRPGLARFEVRSDSLVVLADTLVLRFLPRVGGIRIAPRPDTLLIGTATNLDVVLRDSVGGLITGRPVTWGGSGPAFVSEDGTVRPFAPGTLVVGAVSEGNRDTVVIQIP